RPPAHGTRPASGAPSRGQTQARSGGSKPGGPALTRPGSNPGALPGNVLIADRGNNRLLEVDPHGRVVWRFPRPGDLAPGQTFQVPDDAFFSPDGRSLVATQEDND